MITWDEQEAELAPRVDQLLHSMFQAADVRAPPLIFHAFERFCMSRPQTQLDENQILDLFDEAIRVTEEVTGEDTDTVNQEGFARVVREHNLLSMQNLSTMANAVAVGRLECGRKQATFTDDTGGSLRDSKRSSFTQPQPQPAGRASRRTFIRTASSKANERVNLDKRASFSAKPDSVYQVIRTAVQSHFLFRHLDDAMHREIVQRMIAFPVTAGRCHQEGDKGDYFYVAERGVFDVLVGDDKVHTYTASSEEGKHPCFGELVCLRKAARRDGSCRR